MWPSQYASSVRTSQTIAPRARAFATNAASTIEPLNPASAEAAKRNAANVRAARSKLPEDVVWDGLAQGIAQVALRQVDLLGIEGRVELLPLPFHLLEERLVLLEDFLVEVVEGPEVGQ